MVWPRSIQHVQVQAVHNGRTLPPNQRGVLTGLTDGKLTMWDSYNRTADQGTMWVAVTNMSRTKICIKGGDELGKMHHPQNNDLTVCPLEDATLASIFGEMKQDNPDPP